MKVLSLTALAWMLFSATTHAQPSQPQRPFSPIILQQSDLQAFNTMANEFIPPKFSGMVIGWLQEIANRQERERIEQAAKNAKPATTDIAPKP